MSDIRSPRMATRRAAATAQPLPSRREVLALAGVLAATVLTMAAAVAGLTRSRAPAPASPPTVSEIVGTQPTSTPRVEPGD